MTPNYGWVYLLPFCIFLVPEYKVSLFGVETFFAALVLPAIELSLTVLLLYRLVMKKSREFLYFLIASSLFCAEFLYVTTTYWPDRLGTFTYQLSIVIYALFAIFVLYFLVNIYSRQMTRKTFFSVITMSILYFAATVNYMNPLVSQKGFHAIIDIIYNLLFSFIFAYSVIYSIRENNISRFIMLHGLIMVAISEFGIHYYNYYMQIGNYAIFFEKIWALGILLIFTSFFDQRLLSPDLVPFKSIRTYCVFLVELFLVLFILIIVFSKFLSIMNTASFASFILTAFIVWTSSNYIGMMISKMLLKKSDEIKNIRNQFIITDTLNGPLYKWASRGENQTVFFELNRMINEYNILTKMMIEEYSTQTRFNTIGRISECAISELYDPLRKMQLFLADSGKKNLIEEAQAQLQTYVENMSEVSKSMSVEKPKKDLLSREIQNLVNDYLLVCKRKKTKNTVS